MLCTSTRDSAARHFSVKARRLGGLCLLHVSDCLFVYTYRCTMKRRRFIQLPLVTSTLAASSLSDDIDPLRREVVVNAGADRDGKPFDFLDATFHVKVSGKDTEGRCVIFDTIRHQKLGPALHIHTDCDEWFFVKDGEFKFQVGDKILRLKAGDSLLVPRQTPHAFVKTTEGDARLIIMHQPAVRMEEFFRLASQQLNQSAPARQKIAESYGMHFVGPPLKPD
jgi:mannose-6-phosphate isomerase-like protein (cupin superfamily)